MDANLDGVVDYNDLLVMAQNYDQHGRWWEQGDFNDDHSVNFSDLLTLAQHYNAIESAVQFGTFVAPRSDFATVPEPVSAGLLTLIGLGLLSRRR